MMLIVSLDEHSAMMRLPPNITHKKPEQIKQKTYTMSIKTQDWIHLPTC